jgi:hypothetical protein
MSLLFYFWRSSQYLQLLADPFNVTTGCGAYGSAKPQSQSACGGASEAIQRSRPHCGHLLPDSVGLSRWRRGVVNSLADGAARSPMSTQELRDCPFCGSESDHRIILSVAEPHVVEEVSCSWCRASMRRGPNDQQQLFADWNNRTADGLLDELSRVVLETMILFESVGIDCSKERALLKRVREEQEL